MSNIQWEKASYGRNAYHADGLWGRCLIEKTARPRTITVKINNNRISASAWGGEVFSTLEHAMSVIGPILLSGKFNRSSTPA